VSARPPGRVPVPHRARAPNAPRRPERPPRGADAIPRRSADRKGRTTIASTLAEARAPKSTLNSLTGLRFIAAALVFIYHCSLEFVFSDRGVSHAFETDAETTGFVGVSFFFILSGFVLTWSLRPGDRARAFWRRRFFKIAPNYVATYIAALILLALVGTPSGITQALANLFFIQSWIPNFSYLNSVNDVSWSLSAEAFFYLAFPLLIALTARIRGQRLWYWAGGVAACVLLAPVAAQHLLPSQPHFVWGPASLTQIWFVYLFPAVRAFEFLLGILMARIVMSGRWIAWYGLIPATVLVAGGYLVSLHVPFLVRFDAATVIPLALFIPAAAHADIQGRRTGFSGRAMVRLGEISFALYLVHHLVIVYGHRAFGLTAAGTEKTWGTPTAVAFLLGCLIVSLLLSWALFALVERPAMRRWSRPRRPGARPPAPPQTASATAAVAGDVAQSDPGAAA
jgi:peptidoglycan/LPS O-acetylase OafA/YrhL